MSVRVDKNTAAKLAKELRAITQEAKVDTLAIITTTGARVAFFTKSTADPSEFSAISASLQNAANLAVSRVGFGETTDIMVRCKSGFLILRNLGRFILVAGARNIETFTTSASVLVQHSPNIDEILSVIPEDQY
ncbi:MAG: hypothetical protein D6732_05105 [Methanobacteriota archaeon]|nr:MAG: hypothetical protein D6732_05105 [Euryarchaeota archaeon]